jgi:hypothetical protein
MNNTTIHTTNTIHNITVYNNTTNDENPLTNEVIGYIAITLLIIIVMFCCYIKPKHDMYEKERIDRAKIRLAYRYDGTVSV